MQALRVDDHVRGRELRRRGLEATDAAGGHLEDVSLRGEDFAEVVGHQQHVKLLRSAVQARRSLDDVRRGAELRGR